MRPIDVYVKLGPVIKMFSLLYSMHARVNQNRSSLEKEEMDLLESTSSLSGEDRECYAC